MDEKNVCGGTTIREGVSRTKGKNNHKKDRTLQSFSEAHKAQKQKKTHQGIQPHMMES